MRALMSGIACGLALLAAAPAARADYPEKPLRVIVAWPPGATTDSAARLVAEQLAKRLGQPVTVENRAGANGIIGTQQAAKAAPDGYTLLMATADTHSINPHVYRNLPYDALKGFEPVTLVGKVWLALLARPDLQVVSVAELVAAAKREPNRVTYGTWGIGSTAHVAVALFETAAGIDLLHVPFQGAAPATSAFLGGQVNLIVAGPNGAAVMQKDGRARVLGYGGPQRASRWLPDVPTFAELGLKGAEGGSWYGLVVPAGVPGAVRERLGREISAILAKDTEVHQKIAAFGWEVGGGTPADFAELMRAEYERFGRVVRSRGIRLEQP